MTPALVGLVMFGLGWASGYIVGHIHGYGAGHDDGYSKGLDDGAAVIARSRPLRRTS